MHDAMTINLRLILLGFLALLIGVLVYLVDRPPEQTYFLSAFPLKISLYDIYPPIFGRLGPVLPDFMHVVAFILLTAGVLAGNRRVYAAVCLFWLVVDGAFELGQKYSDQAASLVPAWFDGIFLLENTGAYFKHGTYSRHDMAAIVIGAVVAYLILIYSQDKRSAS